MEIREAQQQNIRRFCRPSNNCVHQKFQKQEHHHHFRSNRLVFYNKTLLVPTNHHHKWMSSSPNSSIENNDHNDTIDVGKHRSLSTTRRTKNQILKSFDTKISQNIQEMISIIDGDKNSQSQKFDHSRNNNDSQQYHRHRQHHKRMLANRWKVAASRENYLYRQRRQNDFTSRPASAEELWDEVKFDLDIPFEEEEADNMSSTSQLSPILGLDIDSFRDTLDDRMGDDSQDTGDPVKAIVDRRDESNSNNSAAIFGDAFHQQLDSKISDEDKDVVEDGDLEEIKDYFNDRLNPSKINKSIYDAIAILSTLKPNEWKIINSRIRSSSKNDFETDDNEEDFDIHVSVEGIFSGEGDKSNCNNNNNADDIDAVIDTQHHDDDTGDDDDVISGVYQLLDTLQLEGESLTTVEANLLLARLATDKTAPIDDVLNLSMQIYREMVVLQNSGRGVNGPDITTYRIMILALSGRLMAYREAVNVSMRMIDELSLSQNVDVSASALLNAMQACYLAKDIEAAERLIDFTFVKCCDDSSSFRPSIGSILLMLDMLKRKNAQSKALELFDRARMSKAFDSKGRDKVLVSLCDWPRRTQKGDSIDVLEPLLSQLLEAVKQEHLAAGTAKPEFRVWSALIRRLANVAKTDESAWPYINRAVTVATQDSHPDHRISQELLRIGVMTGKITSDAKLGSKLIQKAVKDYVVSSSRATQEIEGSTFDASHDSTTERKGQVPIPHQFFRQALEACFRSADSSSSKSILTSFEAVQDAYPMGVQADIKSFGVLCVTKAGEPDIAKEIIDDMVEKGLKLRYVYILCRDSHHFLVSDSCDSQVWA